MAPCKSRGCKIDLIRFQAGCCTRRPNLGLWPCIRSNGEAIIFCRRDFFCLSHCLFSAVTVSMSTILPHMMRPQCEFRMLAGMKCAASASLKIQDAKIRRLRTIAQRCRATSSLYLRNNSIYRQSEKACIKQQYLIHMSSQYGELRPTGS